MNVLAVRSKTGGIRTTYSFSKNTIIPTKHARNLFGQVTMQRGQRLPKHYVQVLHDIYQENGKRQLSCGKHSKIRNPQT